MMSRSSLEEVSITTERYRVRSSPRIRCSTSSPSKRGSLRSRRISCGRSGGCPARAPVAKSRSSASTPSWATTTSLRMLFFFRARMVSASSSGLSSTSRITLSAIVRLLRCGGTEGEEEGGPAPLLSLRPDFSAVAPHHPLHGGQSDAAPLELGRGVQSLEGAEELARVGHVEAGAVVAHVEAALAGVLRHPELDMRLRFPGGVLPGVGEQVLEHHLDQVRVALRFEVRGDPHLHLSLRSAAAQGSHHVVGEV